MKILHLLLACLIMPLLVAMARVFRRPGDRYDFAVANVVAGTVQSHEGVVTRFAEAALPAAHVLVKKGTADDEVLINGANDKPFGWTDDPADSADDELNVYLLGGATRTAVLTASEAITVGTDVFTAASGKVSTLSAVAGTYYKVGTALTAAAADGDEIEVMPCLPVAEVVA